MVVDTLDARTWPGVSAAIRTVARRSPGIVIIVGFGIKSTVIAAFARLGGKRVFLRLGGDTKRDAREVIRSSFASGDYKAAIRAAINRGTLSGLFALTRDIIVVNETLVAKLRPQVSSRTRFFVVPQPVFGTTQDREPSNANWFKLLTIANLRYRSKADGVIWQIERLVEFAKSTTACMRFQVAGDGPHLKDIRDYLATSVLPVNLEVDLLGYVSEVDALYARADIFVYRSEHDGTPNVLLEAMRWGLPIVVNDYDPFLSLLKDQVSGLIYHNSEGFSAAILTVLTDQDLRCQFAAEGHKAFLRRFSVSAVGHELATVLFDRFEEAESEAPFV